MEKMSRAVDQTDGLLPLEKGNWTHKTRAELKTATKSKTQVCSLLTFAYQLLNT